MTDIAVPPPLKKGETYGALVANAYQAASSPGNPMTPIARAAHGMIGAGLESAGALVDGAIGNVSDPLIAGALRTVSDVGIGMMQRSGVVAAAQDAVLGVIAEELGSDIAQGVAEFIPIVGAVVSLVADVLKLHQAHEDASAAWMKERCFAIYVPVVGSFPGEKVVGGDYFWNGQRRAQTSLGQLAEAIEITRAAEFASSAAFLKEGKGYVAEDDHRHKMIKLFRKYRHHNPIPKASRDLLGTLRRAMTALSARYETDGGSALLPLYLDVLERERVAGRLHEDYLRALRALTYADCAWWDARPMDQLWHLLNGWGQSVAFVDVRGIGPTGAAAAAELVHVVATHQAGAITHPQTIVSRLAKRIRLSVAHDATSDVHALASWQPGQPWPL